MTTTQAVTMTERLVLRPWTSEDLDVLHADVLGSPDVMRFSTGVQSRAQVQDWIARKTALADERGFTHGAVERKSDGRLVGLCGLALQELPEGRFLEVGYRLARAVWGQGLATEAAQAVADWTWRNTDLERLTAIIDPRNVRSIRVAEKLGMTLGWKTVFHGVPVEVYQIGRPTARGGGAD